MCCPRVLASCYLEQDWYDLIDIDSFGSDSSTVSAAIDAVRFDGGMLYLTSTGELLGPRPTTNVTDGKMMG